ncbi:MAG: pyruvate dehydrogenase complex E1 component subunit beta [Chloroflexi bacterium]|nr:pyruvate dehydrogenase complex E1 component subunit beta [Chloroflexota bacterium]
MSTQTKPSPVETTYREALNQALREEMRRDERVFLLGEDIGVYGGVYAVTRGLLEEFGERRVRDTPIAESVIVGAGIGSAMGGLRPVAELQTINFSLLAMDQIVNHAAKIRYMSGGQICVPLTIRTVSGGGNQLAAQHSQSFEGWYASVPGLKVAAPFTPHDAKGLLKASIRDDNPVIFIEHSLLYSTRGPVPPEEYLVPLGQAEVRRRGKNVTLVSYSRMVGLCLAAAEKLATEGIEAEVIDLRTLRPLDIETVIASVQRTKHAVVVEEGWRTGGFGAEVASQIAERAFDYLDAPVARLAGADCPMPYAKNLELMALPSEEDIVAAAQGLLGR